MKIIKLNFFIKSIKKHFKKNIIERKYVPFERYQKVKA